MKRLFLELEVCLLKVCFLKIKVSSSLWLLLAEFLHPITMISAFLGISASLRTIIHLTLHTYLSLSSPLVGPLVRSHFGKLFSPGYRAALTTSAANSTDRHSGHYCCQGRVDDVHLSHPDRESSVVLPGRVGREGHGNRPTHQCASLPYYYSW